MISPRPGPPSPEPARDGGERGRRRPAFPADRLDRVDEAIVRQLQDDGRRPFREVARSLGVSEATVRARVRRLTDAGALRIVAIADPFRLGLRVLAFVLLKVAPGQRSNVIDTLTPWPEVTYISSLTGRADVYIQVVCRSHEDLWELLSERLPAIPGIDDTETFMELKMHKIAYRYPSEDGAEQGAEEAGWGQTPLAADGGPGTGGRVGGRRRSGPGARRRKGRE